LSRQLGSKNFYYFLCMRCGNKYSAEKSIQEEVSQIYCDYCWQNHYCEVHGCGDEYCWDKHIHFHKDDVIRA